MYSTHVGGKYITVIGKSKEKEHLEETDIDEKKIYLTISCVCPFSMHP
jgi:hypothetical protein